MTEQKIAEYLLSLLDAGGGMVAKAEVAEKLPFLENTEITRILAEYAPDVHETMVAGIPCWQRIQLPENFAEHFKETVASIERMGFTVSPENINFALSLRYGKNFRKTYGLENGTAFKKFLAKFSTVNDENQRKSKRASDERVLSQIIGLSGKPLPQSTWQGYLRIWRDPRRTEIAKLNAKGESTDEIAQRFGLSEKYIESWILWVHYNMPLILKKNGLTVEDIANA